MQNFIVFYRQRNIEGIGPFDYDYVTAETPDEAVRLFRGRHGLHRHPIAVIPRDMCEITQPGKTDNKNLYRDNIVELIDRQREKGLKKYGQTLEQNTTLSTLQRIEHAQEELVDALQYLEHLKQTQGDKLTVADYERSAMRTLNPENADRFDGWGIYMEAALGLTGEAGEAAEVVKKSLCQGHELDKNALALELGDVAWYLTLFCNAAGLTLEEVLNLNTKKRAERYPEGFDKARSINREEGQKND